MLTPVGASRSREMNFFVNCPSDVSYRCLDLPDGESPNAQKEDCMRLAAAVAAARPDSPLRHGSDWEEAAAGEERGLADDEDETELPLTLRFRVAAGVRTADAGAGLIGVLNRWSSRCRFTGVMDTVEDWMT